MSKHPESVEYAKGLIANGVIEEQIRKLLAISGMSPEEIEEIMTEAKGQPAQQPSGTASQEKQEQQPSVNTTVSAPQTSEDIAAYHQASPMPNDMPSLSNLNAQKPRRHWIPFVVAGIIGTILVVGATAGAAYYMRRPEYVLPKVLANIQNVKNFSYRAKIDLAPPKILPLGIMYEGEGNIDYSNSDDPAFQLIGKINLKLDKEKIAGVPQSYFGAILTQKEIPDSVVISGELRLLHKSLYATLKELQPEQIFGTSSAILNSWVKIGPMLSSSTESLPFPGVDQEKIRKVNDKILSIIKENPPLVLSGPMRSERMDGRTCRKYDLTLRKEGLKELASLLAEEQIAELKRQQAEREAKYKEMYQGYDPQLLSNTSVAENSYALAREKALEIADNIKLENASVWIDTNSYLLCKTEGTIQLPNSDGYENSITKFSIDYFNFNKPSTITAPEKAKTIEEFFLI